MADGAVSGVKRTAEEQLTKENSKNEEIDNASSEVHPIQSPRLDTLLTKIHKLFRISGGNQQLPKSWRREGVSVSPFVAYPFHF